MNSVRQSQYGRSKGSTKFSEGLDRSRMTPEKNQKSSFRTKKNVNFNPQEYMVA